MRAAPLSALIVAAPLLGFAGGANALSNGAYAAMCERATVAASRTIGAPLDLLRAVSLVESRRSVAGEARPWPWTVNTRGQSFWFDTRSEAERFVRNEVRDGNRSMDIGCFQVNTRWHGEAFTSAEAMFDPMANARYAAEFLSALKSETGDWDSAVGLYHSRTPHLRDAYAERVETMLARLDPLPADGLGAPEQETIIALAPTPSNDDAAPGGTVGSLKPGAGAIALRVASIFASGDAKPLFSMEGRGSLLATPQPLFAGSRPRPEQ
ncbi:MAG: lytic transglycosylase domain-containing protein [Pseudomonadota bacterium]